MKTGDAECTVWLEGRGGRSYALSVSSVRRGSYGTKRWERALYQWSVESWRTRDGHPTHLKSSPWRTLPTFAASMRAARRLADQWERAAAKKITPNRRAA